MISDHKELSEIAKQIRSIRTADVGTSIPDDVRESASKIHMREVCGGCSGTGCHSCGGSGEILSNASELEEREYEWKFQTDREERAFN